MRKFKLGSSKGFTLVELLVVIAIIGVLSTLLLLQLNIARAKARDAKRVADINQMRSAMELYYDDCGFYPPGNTGYLGTGCDADGAAPITGGLVRYLTKVPQDPLRNCVPADTYGGATDCYGYAWNPAANPALFHIYAELETGSASALKNDLDADTSAGWNGAGVDATGAACTVAADDCVYDAGQTQ